MTETERARDALHALDPGVGRDAWIHVCNAAQAAGLSYETVLEWSSSAANFTSAADVRRVWNSFDQCKGLTERTLFKLARDEGWRDPQPRAARPTRGPYFNGSKANGKAPAASDTATLWAGGTPVGTHPYLQSRHMTGAGLRLVSGKLAVPFSTLDGTLATLQLIDDSGRKLNLKGAEFGESMHVIGEPPGDGGHWLVCEGIGTGHALARADFNACVAVTAGAARFLTVARALRAKWPDAAITVVGDVGTDETVTKAAKAARANFLRWPEGLAKNFDALDYEQEHGSEALADLLRSNTAAPALRYRSESLAEVVAEVSAERFLVDGLLTAGGFMAVFGPSGSGKSFLVFDLGAALAQGTGEWFGHAVREAARVLFVVLEGENGQRRRILAWHQHTGRDLPEGMRMLRRQPVSIMSPADTEDLCALAQADHADVVVIDTLNRALNGANENDSADVGHAITSCDEIRRRSGCAVLLVAHSGKEVNRGLRGHSSLYAALDTAIETTGTENPHAWSLVKSKDGESGGSHTYRVKAVPLAEGRDGGVIEPDADDATPRDVIRAPTRPIQKLAYEVTGALLRESHAYGKAEHCPPTHPCVTIEAAAAALTPRLIQYAPNKRLWAARRVLSAMQPQWYVTDGKWLWHR
ncbi:AAA family ATPase [Paraburkholderia sp. JHI869]|uniref:AAA family ATPase n=1 Tax=Paraburkholderia sp. JHI869 TaxID=3112959 RepID=UPI00316EC54B